MQYLVHALVFYFLVIVLCVVRSGAGRVFVGIFLLVTAIGINAVLVLVAPDLFVALGTDTLLIPLYPWFVENFVALSPQVFGLLAAAYEITIALTMLSKGRYATWGAHRGHRIPADDRSTRGVATGKPGDGEGAPAQE